MPYQKTGPFHPGAAPPYDANFGNNLENYLSPGVPLCSTFGPYTATTSQTAYNHGLKNASGGNVTPDVILLQVQGGSTTVRTIEYDPSLSTPTQFTAIGNATFNFVGVAMKF